MLLFTNQLLFLRWAQLFRLCFKITSVSITVKSRISSHMTSIIDDPDMENLLKMTNNLMYKLKNKLSDV